MKALFVKSVLMTSLSLVALAGCNNTPPVVQPTPGPSSSTQPSSNPSTTPSEGPSSNPSTAPSEGPSSTPSTTPSEEPSTTPSGSPTPTPIESDISIGEKTTFNGKVYDDTNAPLDGVTIKVRSLSAALPYEATSTSAGGSYAFNSAPAGVQLEITASKAGYATRRRVEVLKSNKQGDPNANRYDFGTDGASSTAFGVAYNALSDKPEVVSVTPGRNASGIATNTSFTLKFSEPMDQDTVEENFGVYGGTTETLSVDSAGPTVLQAFSDAQDTSPAANSLIWDESAFNISWSTDKTEVTFNFKDEQQLLSDKKSENVPDYRVSLTAGDGQIKDTSGVTRDAGDGGYFKLTDGNFEGNYKFSVVSDKSEPELASINALTDENGNPVGDEIKVEFSEPMVYYTEIGEIRGNMDGSSANQDPINPDNYFISINNAAEVNLGTGLGGSATFDTTDRTHKTVLLRNFGDPYAPGDKVKVRVSSSVVDPAGNSVDSSHDEDDDTAG